MSISPSSGNVELLSLDVAEMHIKELAALAREGLKTRMLLQVHDELLFEAPEAEVEKTTQVVRSVM